ncbi:salicylate hydroxylase [Seiridium cupressi]
MPLEKLINDEQPFHVAIIGAGVGGLALAVGLLRQGVSFTLYEAAKCYSMVGAGVGLGPNAIRAMETIQPGFTELYQKISSGNVTKGKDHVMMDAMLAEEGLGANRGLRPMSYGAPCYDRTSAHRKDLLDILTTWIPEENVRFDKRVKNLSQDENGATIEFVDGQVVTASCAIACDGVKGVSRGVVLGDRWPEYVHAKYTGKYVYRSIIPMEDATKIFGKDVDGNEIAGDAKMFMGEKCIITTFPISRGTQTNMVCFRLDDKPWPHPEYTKRVSKEEMIQDISSLGVDKRLVQLLDWATPLQWALFHHLVTPTYFNKRICLLGDSAHATLPHQASGAGQCIEDALILSRLLGLVRNESQLETAFSVYDRIRRPRAQRIVQTSQEAGDLVALKAPGIGADMDKIVENQGQRYLWIWLHDLDEDVRKAETEFKVLARNPSPPPVVALTDVETSGPALMV